MENSIIGFKPPKIYIEGIITYKPGVDIEPNWPTLMKHGYTFEEHLKLGQLIAIEHMKYELKEAIEDNELTEEEVKEAEKLILKAINEYNVM